MVLCCPCGNLTLWTPILTSREISISFAVFLNIMSNLVLKQPIGCLLLHVTSFPSHSQSHKRIIMTNSHPSTCTAGNTEHIVFVTE